MNSKNLISNWLLEDLNLSEILFNQSSLLSQLNNNNSNISKQKKNNTMLRAGYNDYSESYGNYSNHAENYYSDYTDHAEHYYSDYTDHAEHYYSDYTDVGYLDYDNYSNNYGNYTETYGNYSNTCVINCQFQCEVNQYVKHYLNNFSYSDNLDYILVSHYNNLVTYINNAIIYVNNLVTTYGLNSTYKINIENLNNVTLSDIYYADNFNKINDAINAFIDGITNILAKNEKEDFIYKTDMQKLEEILNQIKIPPTVPKF